MPSTRIVVLSAILVVASIIGAKAEPWNLQSYKLCNFYKLYDIPDNASGAAYIPETGTLWIVTNNPQAIWEYTLDGKLKQRINIKWLNDPESITYLGNGKVAVVEEPDWGGIHVLNINRGGSVWTGKRISCSIRRSGGAGLESITYNSRENIFYVAEEHDPKKVFSIDWNGRWQEIINGDQAYPMLRDISDLFYAPTIDMLFVLSQESNRVVKSTKSGQVLQELWVKGSRPEGLAFTPDGRKMIVISEPNEMAIYEADRCSGSHNQPL